jgi:hypothetical protein
LFTLLPTVFYFYLARRLTTPHSCLPRAYRLVSPRKHHPPLISFSSLSPSPYDTARFYRRCNPPCEPFKLVAYLVHCLELSNKNPDLTSLNSRLPIGPFLPLLFRVLRPRATFRRRTEPTSRPSSSAPDPFIHSFPFLFLSLSLRPHQLTSHQPHRRPPRIDTRALSLLERGLGTITPSRNTPLNSHAGDIPRYSLITRSHYCTWKRSFTRKPLTSAEPA